MVCFPLSGVVCQPIKESHLLNDVWSRFRQLKILSDPIRSHRIAISLSFFDSFSNLVNSQKINLTVPLQHNVEVAPDRFLYLGFRALWLSQVFVIIYKPTPLTLLFVHTVNDNVSVGICCSKNISHVRFSQTAPKHLISLADTPTRLDQKI